MDRLATSAPWPGFPKGQSCIHNPFIRVSLSRSWGTIEGNASNQMDPSSIIGPIRKRTQSVLLWMDLIQIWVWFSWIWIPYSCQRLRGNASSLVDLPSLEGPITMSIWLIKKIKEKGKCLITEKWSSFTVVDSQSLDCSNSCRTHIYSLGIGQNSLVPMNYYLGMQDKHNISILIFEG